MAPTAASIWDWTLVVLPFTAIVTFLVTIISCNFIVNHGQSLLPLSQLGSDSGYVYFLVGFALLIPQILAIIIGRLQYLLQTQNIINNILLYIVHGVTLIPLIFMVIVTFVMGSKRTGAHLIANGILGSLALYCVLHTIGVFFLYIKKASGAYYTKIQLPIWFLVWNLVFLASFGAWATNNGNIWGYITAAAPFFYFLGFVPQFWARARSRKRYSAVSRVAKVLDSLN